MTTDIKTMTPAEHCRFYVENVWKQHRVDLIPQLCADPIIRHDFTRDWKISHAEQVERILSHKDKGFDFRIVSIHGDHEYATMIWEIASPTYNVAGIEVMRILDGKIVENWNAKRDGVMWPK